MPIYNWWVSQSYHWINVWAGWCGEGKKSLAPADNRTPIPPSFRQSLILYTAFNPFQPKLILVHTTVTGTCRRVYKTCKNWPLCSYVGWHQHSQPNAEKSAQDDYWSQWAKGMHIKNRWKAWCHMASRGWKGLSSKAYDDYVHCCFETARI